MQNLMVNLSLHPKLPGNTYEERKSLEKPKKGHFGVVHQEYP
jgi:hypothetical protein